MVNNKSDYLYTAGLDGITIDGSILPLRSNAARKLLKGEDLAFLAEALNERSLAATGEFALTSIGTQNKYKYKRSEYENQFMEIASKFANAEDRVYGFADTNTILNNWTDLKEFIKPVDANGELIDYFPYYKPKSYEQSRIDAIGATSYHHAALTPNPQTAKIINVQDELDIFSNERKIVRFFRKRNFDVSFYPAPFDYTSTGRDEDGKMISVRNTAWNSFGWCIGAQWNVGESTYHSDTTPIGVSYVKSGLVWSNNFDELQRIGMQIYNVPPYCDVYPVFRILVCNRTTSGPGTQPLDTYVIKYFISAKNSYGGHISGKDPTNTVNIPWYEIRDSARSSISVWDPPFVHNDVEIPADMSMFKAYSTNKWMKYDCLEICVEPIGAIIELGDHTKWWD